MYKLNKDIGSWAVMVMGEESINLYGEQLTGFNLLSICQQLGVVFCESAKERGLPDAFVGSVKAFLSKVRAEHPICTCEKCADSLNEGDVDMRGVEVLRESDGKKVEDYVLFRPGKTHIQVNFRCRVSHVPEFFFASKHIWQETSSFHPVLIRTYEREHKAAMDAKRKEMKAKQEAEGN